MAYGNKNNPFKDTNILKLTTYTTPVGEAASCFITTPSKEYDEDGTYFVRLRLEDNEVNRNFLDLFVREAENAYKKALENTESPAERKRMKRADPSWKEEEDENGEPTGYITINFKRKAVRTDKNGNKLPFKLPIFDSFGNPVSDIDIWGGSKVALAFKLVPFYTNGVGVGISHRLEAVQVIELVQGGDRRKASDFGFKQQNGFSAVVSECPEDDAKEPTEDEINEAISESGIGDY